MVEVVTMPATNGRKATPVTIEENSRVCCRWYVRNRKIANMPVADTAIAR